MSGPVMHVDPATHRVAEALLPWFVNETLEGEEFVLVEQHLAECVLCQKDAEWLRGLRAACIAGAAEPGASNAFAILGRRLDKKSARRTIAEPRRGFGEKVQSWWRWIIAAELAMVVTIGVLWIPPIDQPASYRTLAADGAAARLGGTVVVVFKPSITEAEMRRILGHAGARIVDGPTRSNGYVLAVPAERRDALVQTLRTERAVVLAEELSRGDTP
jgi:hypothetical protein